MRVFDDQEAQKFISNGSRVGAIVYRDSLRPGNVRGGSHSGFDIQKMSVVVEQFMTRRSPDRRGLVISVMSSYLVLSALAPLTSHSERVSSTSRGHFDKKPRRHR